MVSEAALRRRRKAKVRDWLAIIALFGALLVIISGLSYLHFKTRWVTATITSKSDVCRHNSEGHMHCKYLIYTDHGTFKDTDSLVAGKFNSSDVFGMLQPGHIYRLRVRGSRFGFFSWYPNIIDVKETSDAKGGATDHPAPQAGGPGGAATGQEDPRRPWLDQGAIVA